MSKNNNSDAFEAERSAEIRSYFKELIHKNMDDYKGLSDLIGRNSAYIQQYIERGTPKFLAEKDRIILARYFGVDQKTLCGPLPAHHHNQSSPMKTISKLSVGVSAGDGNLDQIESLAGNIAFDPAWLAQFPYHENQLSIVMVEGDSMLPTLVDGDDILVAQYDMRARKDGVYVIRMDDALMVKRLSFGPGQSIDIMSDNPSYRNWHGVDPHLLNIIGHVIWVGRKI